MSQQLFSGVLDKLREIKQVRQVVFERQKSDVSVVRSWMLVKGKRHFTLFLWGRLNLNLIGLSRQQCEQIIGSFGCFFISFRWK
jgi:hypothetical protein